MTQVEQAIRVAHEHIHWCDVTYGKRRASLLSECGFFGLANQRRSEYPLRVAVVAAAWLSLSREE